MVDVEIGSGELGSVPVGIYLENSFDGIHMAKYTENRVDQ
jgi:hypothetical protein